MFETIFDLAKELISQGGYVAIAFLMMLESMIFPIPSEAVMPFAGFLIVEEPMRFSWLGVLLASSAGSLLGSYLSYFIGLYGGRPFLERYGKFFLLDMHHLRWAEDFLAKSGDVTIFWARFVPVVRHLISIPAGACRMPHHKFATYTLLGASLWNMFLAVFGYVLGENWYRVKDYMHYVDYAILAILCILAIYIYLTHIRPKAKA